MCYYRHIVMIIPETVIPITFIKFVKRTRLGKEEVKKKIT